MDGRSIVISEIKEILSEGKIEDVVEFLKDQPPYDIAAYIQDLEPEYIAKIILALGQPLGPDAFQKLPTDIQAEALDKMSWHDGARLLEGMDPDERADLVKALPESSAERIIPLIAQAKRNEIASLVQYKEGTAGSVMTTEYAALNENLTIAAALSELRKIAPDRETLYNVYVVDDESHLVGMIPLKDMFVRPSLARLKDVMKDVKSVKANQDVEEVARVVRDYDLVSIPVVDEERKLIGIVTIDDIIDVFEAEATEDMYRHGAVYEHTRYLPANPLSLARQRVVWLIVLALVGFITGSVIDRYESMVTAMFALAVFMPVIIDSGGNAGTQASTVIIRGLATGEVSIGDWFRIFWKEIAVGLSVGITVAVVGAFRGYLMERSLKLALAVGLALVVVITFATVLGAILPLIFKRLKIDPAVVSGPLITSVLDVLGLLIYFEIAHLVLNL